MMVEVQDVVIDARLELFSAGRCLLRVGGCYLSPQDVIVMGLRLRDATEPEKTALHEAGFLFEFEARD